MDLNIIQGQVSNPPLRWFRLRRELSRTACSLNRNILVQSRTIEPAKTSKEGSA